MLDIHDGRTHLIEAKIVHFDLSENSKRKATGAAFRNQFGAAIRAAEEAYPIDTDDEVAMHAFVYFFAMLPREFYGPGKRADTRARAISDTSKQLAEVAGKLAQAASPDANLSVALYTCDKHDVPTLQEGDGRRCGMFGLCAMLDLPRKRARVK